MPVPPLAPLLPQTFAVTKEELAERNLDNLLLAPLMNDNLLETQETSVLLNNFAFLAPRTFVTET